MKNLEHQENIKKISVPEVTDSLVLLVVTDSLLTKMIDFQVLLVVTHCVVPLVNNCLVPLVTENLIL